VEERISDLTIEQEIVRARVLGEYLPDWCAAPWQPERYDPAFFRPDQDWSFLTPGLAHWFLVAIDEGVVEVSEGDFWRNSSSEGIFEQHGPKAISPRPIKLRRESFFEIAAVGMLAVRYGWPLERLSFLSKDWSLDFLAHADKARSKLVIAGEAKRLQRDAVALSASLKVCGARGDHEEADCTERRNHHRKYTGLLRYQPRILWIAGPDAFGPEPDLVFRVEERRGGIVRLHRVDASELAFTPPRRRARSREELLAGKIQRVEGTPTKA
jgi:hypothetical protein